MIANCGGGCVKVWDHEADDGWVRTFVWLEPHDYVVTLAKKAKWWGP